MTRWTLGLSAFYHDSAAAIVRDGVVVAAAQEERFSRRKGDASFPISAITYCLEESRLEPEQLSEVVFYDRSDLTFDRLVQTHLSIAPSGADFFRTSMERWTVDKLQLPEIIRDSLEYSGPIYCIPHHLSHAAAAFYPSPFERAAILTVDGVGEWATASYGIGDARTITQFQEQQFPDSLGLLYSAFTFFCGFKVNFGEYKLMGLAPYGTPRFLKKIRSDLVELQEDGSIRLNMRYFDFLHGQSMVNAEFSRLFDGPPREPESRITRREMDLAASIQAFTEDALLCMARYVHQRTQLPNLCLAGGVALNCVANGRLHREGPFRKIWIQPAAGDAGSALGAALAVQHGLHRLPRENLTKADTMRGAYLGPAFSQAEVEAVLAASELPFEKLADGQEASTVAGALADGQIVGFFQGRMEFGPRALGARSILGDPRSQDMQSKMNLKIKYRESFRPFAPAVLAEDLQDYFDLDTPSPYMLMVAQVRKDRQIPRDGQLPRDDDLLKAARQIRSDIPAVTHWNYSARIQTVHSETNPAFYDVLTAFKQRTGCSVLVNTSFNVRGEPIVCTPQDAVRCFLRTEMDALYVQGFWLLKAHMPPEQLAEVRKHEFPLD